MNQNVGFGDAILADGDNFGMGSFHANPKISILAEDHRLAMFQVQDLILAHAAFGEVIEGMIVEDVAVLIDLQERHAFVSGRGFDHRAQVLDVNVDGARDEGCFAGDRQRQRINRIVDYAHRG